LVCIFNKNSVFFCSDYSINILNCDYLVLSISCYKCESTNGSNQSCEDLFQGDIYGAPSYLHVPCFTQLRGRKGNFYATHCIKLVAYTSGNLI